MTVEKIQAICKKLSAVTEDIKWEMILSFLLVEKCFAWWPAAISGHSIIQSKEEEFDEMCSREGFKPAPYVAKYKWVWMGRS
jgi:predicted DNA-binding protein (MmcQ/YjbR family)